ncbi:hypothetical protein [Fundidesulfovibrio agrisoli]|uniref:hypothetical protein n=1 Tax=Fundidesulfovibrio agrisoli TaxID=2922717 RepID=UPI001FABA4D3|nr:hypothetical protein [Fundidesulfovibrio agrisoli]
MAFVSRKVRTSGRHLRDSKASEALSTDVIHMKKRIIFSMFLAVCVISCASPPPEQFFKSELHTRNDLFRSYGSLLGVVDTLFSKIVPGVIDQETGAPEKQFSFTVNDFVRGMKAYGPNSKWEKKENGWILHAESKDALTGTLYTSHAQFDVDPASGKVTLTRYIGIDGVESEDLDKLLISILYAPQ